MQNWTYNLFIFLRKNVLVQSNLHSSVEHFFPILLLFYQMDN